MKVWRILLSLLLLAGLIGFGNAPSATAEDAAPVRVSTAQELVEAIAPGAVIELEPGTYNLSAFLAELDGPEAWRQPWVELVECFDGYELVVENVENLSIRGLGADCGETEIVVEPRYADVLRFVSCAKLRLENLTLGHTVEQGSCVGDVLDFESCEEVALKNLDLYGCGTYGICANLSRNLRLEESTIRDCSYGILSLDCCTGFRFVDCELRDCEGYDMLSLHGSSLSFDNCRFEGNYGLWSFLNQEGVGSVHFYACAFGPWESQQLRENPAASVSFDELCTFDLPRQESGPVVVDSPEALFAAIAPGATIYIRPGHYNLSDWLETAWAEEGPGTSARHPYVRLQECYDGVEAVIAGADGLSICGLGQNRSETELVVEPRYANVLGFENCAGVSLSGLTLGHTQSGECSGSVLYFDTTEDVTLTNLDLYGCGVFGVYGYELQGLTVRDSTLRDCSVGPVNIVYGARDVVFEDSVFTGSDGGFYFDSMSAPVLFRRCVFGALEAESLRGQENVFTENCLFQGEPLYGEYGA